MDDTLPRVMDVIKSSMGLKELTPETDLIIDLQMDSLDAVEIAMDLEEEFNIDIPDEILTNEKMRTVGQLVDWVRQERRKP